MKVQLLKDILSDYHPNDDVEDEDGKEHLIIDFRTLLNRTLLEESK